MAQARSTLRDDDLSQLREALLALLKEDRDEEVVDLVLELISRLHRDNARMAKRLNALLRGRAGSGSEKLSKVQLQLFIEELNREEDGEGDEDVLHDDDDDGDDEVEPKRKPRRGPPRVDAEPERVVHEPDDADQICPTCGKPKSCIGHDECTVLEFKPARFRVVIHARAKYACKACSKEGGKPHIVIAPVVPRPIPGGWPMPSLLADLVLRKHLEHQPVHRIAQSYGRLGADIPTSTLYDWTAASIDLLEPLAKRVHHYALQAHLLQVDDTGLAVLDRDDERGIRRGHLWGCLGDSLWTSFFYTADWKAEGPEAQLATREGWMQADAYVGFDRLYKAPYKAVEVACWSHTRRYFVKALESGDKRAALPLALIKRLFFIERRSNKKGHTPEERLRARQQRSKPVLRKLGAWVSATYPNAPPDTLLGQAITYIRNQWAALKRFLEDGCLPLSNNDCERLLRHICLGRKNWLFAGSDAGAKRLAVIYTLIGTAVRTEGLDIRAWLKDVLDKLSPDRRFPASRIDELLPPFWAEKAAEEKAARQAG